MLITDKNAPQISLLQVLRNGILLLVIPVVVYHLFCYAYISFNTKNTDPNIILCDMENTFRGNFVADGKLFSGGDQQRNTHSKSGKYSCLLMETNERQYALGHELTQVEPGTIYEFSVWYLQPHGKTSVALVASNKSAGYYKSTDKVVTIDEKKWSKLMFTDTIPDDFNSNHLSIHVYTNGSINTYLDDLQIRTVIKNTGVPVAAEPTFEAKTIGLQLNKKQLKKIKTNRNKALDRGIIITDEDSWSKGNLIDDGQKKSAKMRLKGDWLDHLEGKKWSFRIKLKDPQTFNRLVTFSVHTPKARFHSLEWLLHKFWERENVLTTRYDFVNLSFNDDALGIYAYEEHFEKQLVESKSRREGPILKFSEDALWRLRLHQMRTVNLLDDSLIVPAAHMQHAKIDAFKEKKILKSPTLSKQFENGKILLYQFQQGTKEASEIFDVDLMAKYLAIIDLMGATHALVWHNMRFYFNPITGKLEPIGFDGFVSKPHPTPMLFAKEMVNLEDKINFEALLQIIYDEKMMSAYMKELQRISDKDYINNFVSEMRVPFNNRKHYIQKEFPEFDYSIDLLIDRARYIRKNYAPIAEHVFKTKWISNNGVTQIEVANLSHLPFKITGFGKESLAGKFLYANETRLLTPPIGAERIYFQVPGIDTIYSNPLQVNSKWGNFTATQKLARFKTMPASKVYSSIGEKIIFKKGNYDVVKDIIIPTDHEVVFEAGCNLNFIGKAKFISQSPITMLGTEMAPISITSKDGLANGFTVLKAAGKSKLSHVHFTGFNTLNYEGWILTGAVTFYESDVDINNSSFNDGKCEDGLNIVYSNFNLENVTIDGAASDGFDADFCKGNIINCIFKNTKNDGVDVSGSQILIEQTMFSNCGDKAVSIGEESKAYLKSVTIENAVIGLASKDKSTANIESISLSKCNQGFAAYQKKPEFGSSLIVVEDYTSEDVKYLYKLGVGSKLQLGSRLIVGEGE